MKKRFNYKNTELARTLRWNLGEIIAQLLVIPAVLLAAYAGLGYSSWWVSISVLIPLLSAVWLITKKLSGRNPYKVKD